MANVHESVRQACFNAGGDRSFRLSHSDRSVIDLAVSDFKKDLGSNLSIDDSLTPEARHGVAPA